MSSSKQDSARPSSSDVKASRRSVGNLDQSPGTSSNAQDQRKLSMHSSHKKGVHEILYVHPTLRIVVSGMSGLLFGIALEKSRVFEPQVIRDQMLFRRFAMLKMFLAAAGGGIISFSVIRSMPEARKALNLAIHEYLGCIRLKTVSSVLVGSSMLGCGMTLAGACPGLVTVQLGAGVGTAVYTILGGLSGGLLYALLFPLTWRMFRPKEERPLNFMHELVNTTYNAIALPLLIPIFFMILSLELYSPWEVEAMGIVPSEIPSDPSSSLWKNLMATLFRQSYPVKVIMQEESIGLMKAPAWTPFYSGILVGLLQIPVVLANQDTLGTSTSYVTIGAQVLALRPLQNLFSYFKDYKDGWINWWQVIFVSGSIMGGFLSSFASEQWATVSGVPLWHAFSGGLLMIYGARLAGGCTSGHGLSGMGLLALVSFVAVPAMFGGGILTAFALRHIGFEGFVD